jgi:ATP-dependent RNA helicase SUPV3L1/SUV3
VLGPTNTGKTHLAIERMLGHGAGMIGLPLRLLAREVYNKVVSRVGPELVALVTGEEKIKPDKARYWIATAEAMPRDIELPFIAIDEVQIAGDLERGHVFTDRILNRRGSYETLLLGSGTMKPILEKLIPGLNVVTRPRLSNLEFAGDRKLTRLPRRSAIVAFSADEVYAIAELIRRQRGGAAVVLGALSPRTRNAQVEMYQNGDVDYLVATDAIGMGLNLDVDHVAFAGDRKFDGYQFRRLNPGEFGQIAGRAGRHVRDGTFGTTGRCEPFEAELSAQIEAHDFESVKVLQWRNPQLDFSSFNALIASLSLSPTEPGLTRAPDADDMRVLGILGRDAEVRDMATGSAAVERLWDVALLPDYRKISPHAHADIVRSLYGFLMRDGRIPDDWFARQVQFSDRTDGDIDTLSTRIAHIRTWTFAANRPDWLKDHAHWQAETRNVEDRLSDALHERLAQRFVDRRTSVLMRRLRENAMLETEVTKTGEVIVEGQHVGTLLGFQFAPDPTAGDGESGRALRAAASKALAAEIEAKALKFGQAPDNEFALAIDGTIRWIGEPVGKLTESGKALAPRVRVLADEQLTGTARDQVQTRLDIWISNHVTRLLGPLKALEANEELQGMARGVAFQLVEALGVLDRQKVSDDVKSLDQAQRATLRKLGVRFGAYHIYLPALMKPAPRTLAAQLWALDNGGLDQKGLDELPHLAASGRTSFKADPTIDKTLYRLIGYRVAGERAVRVDILERLADIIRPAIAYRPGTTVGAPPEGTADGDGFVVTVRMTSLVGCSGEDFASILKGLGYRNEKRKGPAITQPIRMPAPTQPVVVETEPATPETTTASDADATAPVASADEGAEAAPTAETALPVEPAPEELQVVEAEAPVAASVDEPVVETTDATQPEAEATPTAGETAEAAEAAEAAAPTAEAEHGETVAPDAAPEPVEIEVWRPGRFERPQRPQHARPRDARPPHRDRAPAAAVEGAAPGQDQAQPHRRGRPEGERRDDRGPRLERFDRGPRPDRRPEGTPRPAEARDPSAGPAPQRDNRGPRPDAPRGDAPRPMPPRSDAPRPDRGRDDRGPRPDRNRDDRGPRPDRNRDDRPRSWSTDEPSKGGKDKAPDPNSPFAKLLALKEQMQGGKSGKGE